MILKADGGSTKVEWLLLENGKEITRCVSTGLNPSLLDADQITKELQKVVADNAILLDTEELEFFGAGCTPAASQKMRNCLAEVFTGTKRIVVDSDIIGAAKALCGNEEGIACILGTGACSCLWGKAADASLPRVYDGMTITEQTPALGYILGDEGSGAVMGRNFINALYKHRMPETLKQDFEKEYGIDMFGIIDKVYRQPTPNKWLASLSPFILQHISIPEVERVVTDSFRLFFEHNILPYHRPDLSVSFVGSVAYYYEKQLRSVAAELNITIGRILKSPLA